MLSMGLFYQSLPSDSPSGSGYQYHFEYPGNTYL